MLLCMNIFFIIHVKVKIIITAIQILKRKLYLNRNCFQEKNGGRNYGNSLREELKF